MTRFSSVLNFQPITSSTKHLFTCSLAVLLFAISVHGTLPPLLDSIKSPIDGTLFGLQIAAMGDQNGDGYDDFLVSDPPDFVRLYYGGPTISGPILTIDSAGTGVSNCGDLNHDGFADFAVPRFFNFTYNRTFLYFGGPAIDTIPDYVLGTDTFVVPIGNIYQAHDLLSLASNALVATQSFEEFPPRRIQIKDVATLGDSLTTMVLRVPEQMIPDYNGITSCRVGDFNGDGSSDLVIGVQSNGNPAPPNNGRICFFWGGNLFDTLPDLIIRRPGPDNFNSTGFGSELENLGDANGDGNDDILAGCGNSQDTSIFLYLGGPDIDTIPDLIIDNYYSQAIRGLGDVNDDGFADFATNRPLPVGGIIFVFYGSQNPDNVADLLFSGNELMGVLGNFGQNMAGVGDVNNDGVNDFAVSCFNGGAVKGMICVFAGQKSTAVDPDLPVVLPSTSVLKQNYPNPFNPSTNIDYTLSKVSQVTIKIYNSLGTLVRTLVSQKQPAGEHSIPWDGVNDAGRRVASGTYFYELATDVEHKTRKMILLK